MRSRSAPAASKSPSARRADASSSCRSSRSGLSGNDLSAAVRTLTAPFGLPLREKTRASQRLASSPAVGLERSSPRSFAACAESFVSRSTRASRTAGRVALLALRKASMKAGARRKPPSSDRRGRARSPGRAGPPRAASSPSPQACGRPRWRLPGRRRPRVRPRACRRRRPRTGRPSPPRPPQIASCSPRPRCLPGGRGPCRGRSARGSRSSPMGPRSMAAR
jgi:hypothetical protein